LISHQITGKRTRLSFKAISLGEKMLFQKSKKNKNSYEKEQRKNYAISFNHESLC